MKAFRTLLKIAARDLETLRRALAAQIERRRTIEERILGHQQSLRAEQMLAVRDYESQRAYSGFAIVTAQGLQALACERDIVDQELARLRALIAEAHVEKRKFERLIELEETRTRVAREKREDAELDEMATMRAGRPR